MEREVLDIIVSEELNNECYDIMDVVTEIQMQECVWAILSSRKKVIEAELAGMQVRVNNHYKGYVSVSTENGTGVADTLYYILLDKDSTLVDVVYNLIEMINEAYYSTL